MKKVLFCIRSLMHEQNIAETGPHEDEGQSKIIQGY
jgi:hypothetical protein